jgi:hypothetical protein
MAVSWIAAGPFMWRRKALDRAPAAEGVYAIVSGTSVIYLGKGSIKGRLVGHWNKENSTDARIWSNNPTHYWWEVSICSCARQAELLRHYPTACNTLLCQDPNSADFGTFPGLR